MQVPTRMTMIAPGAAERTQGHGWGGAGPSRAVGLSAQQFGHLWRSSPPHGAADNLGGLAGAALAVESGRNVLARLAVHRP